MKTVRRPGLARDLRRGRHPAGLNFGDCMSYATAQLAHEPLLAIGNDFTQTDLEFGEGIIGYWPTRHR